jgi:hypothetical protein
MNLKEEIISSLQDNKWYISGGVWDGPADDILEVIKEKIDSILKEEAANYDKGFPVGDFNEGFIVGVRRVKELLK